MLTGFHYSRTDGAAGVTSHSVKIDTRPSTEAEAHQERHFVYGVKEGFTQMMAALAQAARTPAPTVEQPPAGFPGFDAIFERAAQPEAPAKKPRKRSRKRAAAAA